MTVVMAAATDRFSTGSTSSFEVLALVLVLGVLVVAVAKLASSFVATALDRGGATRTARPRSGQAAHHQRFTRGFLPHADELLGVGYLKGRISGVAETLLADAVSSGWLVADNRTFSVGSLPNAASESAAAFYAELRRRGVLGADAVRSAAEDVAARLAPSIRDDLRAARLLRSSGTRSAARFAMLALVGVLAIGGVSRVLRTGMDFVPSMIALLEIVLLVIFAMTVSGVSEVSDEGARYVEWLDGVTDALTLDVESGRSHEHDDVVLAAALGGAARVRGLEGLVLGNDEARPFR